MVNGTRAAVAITLAISGTAAAQATATGSLRGIITDREFGTPVAEASITVLGTRARGTTSETGAFLIRDVPPGTYTVVIAKDGYVREVRPNVRVGEGALVDLDAAMAGEFEDMEEFVVQDVETAPQDIERQDLVVPEAFEPILVLPPVDFQLRLEAPQLLDVLNVDMINRDRKSVV